MSRAALLLSVAVVFAVACERPAERTHEREFAAKVMTGLLAYPRSSLVDVSAGQDAAQVTLSTPAPPDEVATWYRRMLRLNGWDLVNDGLMGDGSVSIYAEKGKRPLWIRLKGSGGGSGTTYTLIGAQLPRDSAADSAPAVTQRSGSSMSSNRIQRR
jgi:hypothetical protein